jgi:hypothetical protein
VRGKFELAENPVLREDALSDVVLRNMEMEKEIAEMNRFREYSKGATLYNSDNYESSRVLGSSLCSPASFCPTSQPSKCK